MGKVFVGISSWADPELLESGFYPPDIKTPRDRLRYYATYFSVVELDSSYHFLFTARNLNAWIEATPPGFIFEVMAFSLLTQHPTPLNSLPRDLREKAGTALNKEGNLYLHNLPDEITNTIWERFADSVQPLYSAGKMGSITFQFPPWFHPSPQNYEYILECQEKLSGYRMAIEFRTGSWLNDEHQGNTLRFLRENGLALVCVDEPQGFKSSLPPLAAVTASFAVVRFHGRNQANWERKDVTPNEKYNYLYNEEEIKEWASKIQPMVAGTEQVFIIFKNKHQNYAVKNARQMMELLNIKPSPPPVQPASF